MTQAKARSHTFLVIAEGEDDESLCKALCDLLNIQADVFVAKSKDNIRTILRAAIKIPGPPVTKIGIMRDAEDSADNQFRSAADALGSIDFPIPSQNLIVARDEVHATAILINPPQAQTGSIESLMFEAVEHQDAYTCTTLLMDCLKERGAAKYKTDVVELKAKMAVYLASCATDRTRHRVGMGIPTGAFNLDAACFDPIKAVLTQLSE